jgi:aminopeptidase 2
MHDCRAHSPDGTTIETVTSAGTTTTTVIHADGTTLSVSTLGNEDAAAEQQPKQRVLLPTTATPSHYSVHLTPDMEAFTFSGEETVSLIINEGGISEIQLHALDITIASASFHTASGANIASTGITYQKEKLQTATIAFSESLPAGPGELKLAFQGELNDKMCGFYRSTYEVDGVKKVMATTQFEATDARRAFPCWDEPAQKATFAFTLTVPKHMTAVSNMPVRSEVAAGPDTQTVAFETSVKMSSYLGAFVVVRAGRLTCLARNQYPLILLHA